MMKKLDFVKSVQAKAQEGDVKLSQKDVSVVLDAVYDAMLEAVKAGEDVKICEVTFKRTTVPARDGVSKLFGENKPWHVDAHDEITIKRNKGLKEAFAE